MPLLIDTCVLLWILADSEKLSENSRKEIKENSPCYVSSISLVEIEIKRSIGKLDIPGDYRNYIELSGLKELEYSFKDSEHLNKLPFHHKDPFDRMLISQAISRNLRIISADKVFNGYPAKVTLIQDL